MSNMNGYGAEVNENDESLVPEIRLPGAVFEPAEDNEIVEVEMPAPDSVPVSIAPKQKKAKKERLALAKPSLEVAEVAEVPRERKERKANRSLLLKGLSFDKKRDLVLKNLSDKLGVSITLVNEEKFEAVKVVVGGTDLHVKFQKIEKENPDRSLKFFVYPSEFRGKKVSPVARCYEKNGRVYISRFFDKIDNYLAKKSV